MRSRHVIGAELEIEIRNKKGRLIEHRKQESKSFVKQFIDMLYGLMKAYALTLNVIEITKTDGTTQKYPYQTEVGEPMMDVNAAANKDDYGIVVGTSDEAVGYDDYNLKARIEHGTGAGQLLYGATIFETPWKDETEYKFRINRSFTNNSGASITVKEVGLIARFVEPTYFALLIRDVLDSPVSIPDGATLTVRYVIKIVVP